MKCAKTKEYYKILSPDYPDWLDEYINTKKLQAQKYVSVTNGTIYTELLGIDTFYSSLDHSIAVALIVWHFTKDKKQTLAGLFHDIATPAFKHCVDILNGDAMKQESTEALTTEFIKKSDDVMKLLKRDGIKLEEIDNYHIYPIADNDTPQLSSDRLEYSFSNGLYLYHELTLDDIREIYNDIEIQKNESGIEELGFKTKAIARKFVQATSRLSVIYRGKETRYSMFFITDILKKLKDDGKLAVEDLFNKKESDIIKLIENSAYKADFDAWREVKTLKVSATPPKGIFYCDQPVKLRYIDPLWQGQRMSKACKIAKKAIDKNLAFDQSGYVYLEK